MQMQPYITSKIFSELNFLGSNFSNDISRKNDHIVPTLWSWNSPSKTASPSTWVRSDSSLLYSADTKQNRRDRNWAEYDLFYYFYSNYFLSSKFSSFTNYTNNSYDISERIQNLTGRVGSLPILRLKGTTQQYSKQKEFPFKKLAGPQEADPPFSKG